MASEAEKFRAELLGEWIGTGCFALVCLFFLSGCATIVRGTTEPVRFSSDPPGALVKVGGGQSCATPCTLTFKRNASLLAQYTKDRCETGTVSLYPTMSGVGVVMGGMLDHALGSTYTLQPNPAHLVMRCRPTEAEESDGE